ncbi:MAG: SpoIID/LytB domain-containing protein [Elusimicrobia bacterium]|nr:SpoIID/LytB domain-containing protein [Elusimicrobiota bacterium]
MRALVPALLLALTGPGAPAGAESSAARRADRIIAVGILASAPSATFRPSGAFKAIDQATGELVSLVSGRDYPVEAESVAAKPGLVFGPHLMKGPARLLPGGPDDFVSIGARKYRGNLVFRPNPDGTLTVVDELGLEEYLFGVLPHEMSPDWPLEALKAQAVVSRTFALNSLGKHEAAGFDLTDDTLSQVYTGLTTESERVRQAVRATAGETLSWRGKPLRVYFHSTCGGHTSDPAEVWGGDSDAPLAGVKDRWCKASPHYRWEAYFPRTDIVAALNRNGLTVAQLLDVREGRRGRAGWLKELRLKTEAGWSRVSANQFRRWLGTKDLKSVRFEAIRERRKGFDFEGRGYGHGVGLCQWGARGQAEAGRDYEQILALYFPGADLEQAGE